MVTRGTRTKTREQFENAMKSLGAEVSIDVGEERSVVSVSTLARNFPQTVALVQEMLTQPRWEASELALAKASTVAGLQASRAEPGYLADMTARRAMYGDGILANDERGTPASIAALTMDDLKRFMAATWSPRAARIRVAGAVSEADAQTAFAGLARTWTGPGLPPAGSVAFAAPDRTRVYFYDVPGAKQSSILMVRPGPARGAPDWFRARAANFILGGGGFAALPHFFAVIDIIAQDQRAGVVADEIGADHKGFCQAVGGWLFRIAEVDAESGAIAKQRLEHRQVARRGNDQDVADPGQHQDRQRIENHRLVINGKQLLRDRQRCGVQAGTAAPRKNDTLHSIIPHGAGRARHGR
jgi:predicted Zn-dependent peptidase